MVAVFGITQADWFERHRDKSGQRAYFWLPTRRYPRKLKAGDRWYFREPNGDRGIQGFGEFSSFENLTPQILFEKYGSAAGYKSVAELIERIARVSRNGDADIDSSIGVAILEDLVILPEPLILRPFPRVSGGSFGYFSDSTEEELHRLLPRPQNTSLELPPGLPPATREYLKESTFVRNRQLILDLKELYGGRCQISGAIPLDGRADNITEGHHIVWLTHNGTDTRDNIVIVSPDWHRALHAADAQFDWHRLSFIVNEEEIPLKLNQHLRPRGSSHR